MGTHNPRQVLETLRDHLTQPETHIAFLFGAGTSSAVRIRVPLPNKDDGSPNDPAFEERALIPNVAELTAICNREIRKLDPEGEAKRFASALELVEGEAQPTGRTANIEDILSCVRRKLHAIGNNDRLVGLSRDDLELLEATIRRTIAAQVNPDKSNFPERLPHEDLVRWIARMPRQHPVEIFTTNYDVLLETALEAERVSAFDGFVGCNRPFFCHESLVRPESAPGAAWARLWKVHGSINWQIDTVRGHKRVVRTQPNNEGEMIMPSHHKYDESRKQPYSAFLDRLTRVLERDDTILITCGYSFSDEHINAILFDSLEAKQRPHIIALQYADPEQTNVIVERAARFLNFMVLARRSAIIGGKTGDWALADNSAVPFLDGAFTLDVTPDGEQPSLKGEFLLGDFVKFSQFLASLTGPAL
ncbi:MAG TPA: SIR2 family protein [Rhizomicrobium sp.]